MRRRKGSGSGIHEVGKGSIDIVRPERDLHAPARPIEVQLQPVVGGCRGSGRDPELEPVQLELDVDRDPLAWSTEGLAETDSPVEPDRPKDVPRVDVDLRRRETRA